MDPGPIHLNAWQTLRAQLNEVLPASTLRGRFARGAFWSLVAMGLSTAARLLISIFTARWLGKTAFGELGMILSTAGMFGVLAGMGLSLTAAKHLGEYREREPERFTARLIDSPTASTSEIFFSMTEFGGSGSTAEDSTRKRSPLRPSSRSLTAVEEISSPKTGGFLGLNRSPRPMLFLLYP